MFRLSQLNNQAGLQGIALSFRKLAHQVVHGTPGGCLAVVQAQVVSSVCVALPAIRICAGQCLLPRPNYRIYNFSFDWPGDLIKACCHFCASYPWKILVINLYSRSATLAKHPKFLSHRHTIHRAFCGRLLAVAQATSLTGL